MDITKTLKVSYPTVTYHSLELFVSVRVSDGDLPETVRHLPEEQRFPVLDNLANQRLLQAAESEYAEIHHTMCKKYGGVMAYRILPEDLEAKLIAEGRIEVKKR